MTPCTCWTCRHPTPENAGPRALHHLRHVEFGEYLAARAPFTEPTPRALVVMTGQEMWVSALCDRPRDRGLPAHPVHT